jgi:hypothetical protein
MKRSNRFDTVSLVGVTALSMSVLAGLLAACSSESTRAPDTAATNEPNEPNDSASPSPSSPTKSPTEAAPDASASTPPGDCKRAAPSNACGVDPQCGCASGQTCDVVDSNGIAKCVTAGDAPMGHPCSASADCKVGLTCLFGICHAFCSDPTKSCSVPSTGACVQIKTTEGAEVPNLAICRVACDLHDPKSCGGTTSAGTGVCRVDDKGETECQSGGARNEGETCSPKDDCGPGLVCANSSSASRCKRWCRVGQNDCSASKKCTGFSNEVKVRDVVYGACS